MGIGIRFRLDFDGEQVDCREEVRGAAVDRVSEQGFVHTLAASRRGQKRPNVGYQRSRGMDDCPGTIKERFEVKMVFNDAQAKPRPSTIVRED